MAKRPTVEIANSNILSDGKLYLKRARLVLPYLVRQAKAGRTIFYSQLAKEVEIPNERNLNYVLGAIGRALIGLGKKEKSEIPPLQCLVINKRFGLPGEGAGRFIDPEKFNKMNSTQNRKMIDVVLSDIYSYSHWDWVLGKLGLSPLNSDISKELLEAKKYKGGGESEQHRIFKYFIAKNPSQLGLDENLEDGHIEYCLPSADEIDVLFHDKNLKIGVEVKSILSDASDILRGLFQCVKYKHLIEAEQIVQDTLPNSRVILALQGKLPKELILVKNLLGVEVVENIKTVN
jgi:hypothetical protein